MTRTSKNNRNKKLTVSTPKNLRIGGDVQYKRDLSRYVKWPKYVRLQRKRKILYDRIPIPPSLNQFSLTFDKNQASSLFRLLSKYQPESTIDRKARVKKAATLKAAGSAVPASIARQPTCVKFGVNHVTELIEQGKAKLVVIAHDVDPVELVVCLPALCRKMDIPYCIVKGKARLGKACLMKTATCLALTEVNDADKHSFAQIVSSSRKSFNENWDNIATTWGNSK